MLRHEFTIPSQMNLAGTTALVRALDNAPSADEYFFDFSSLGHISPLGMALGASAIRRFRHARLTARCVAVGYEGQTYAAHMGFFQAFGLKAGLEPGEAPGSNRYVPVTILTVESILEEAWANRERFQELLVRKANDLASVLTRSTSGPLWETIAFCLREVFRNVLEHSKSAMLSYAAQYWPTKGVVELAVVDEGMGVRESLSANPHLEVTTDDHALSLSLLPGVSGTMFRGKRSSNTDEWHNSGYGLFMVSRLCSSAGAFFIGSGSSGLYIQRGERDRFTFPHLGTALQLRLRVGNRAGLEESLGALRKEGQEIAKSIKGAVLTASRASSMLDPWSAGG